MLRGVCWLVSIRYIASRSNSDYTTYTKFCAFSRELSELCSELANFSGIQERTCAQAFQDTATRWRYSYIHPDRLQRVQLYTYTLTAQKNNDLGNLLGYSQHHHCKFTRAYMFLWS